MINEICLYFQNDERISEFNQETFAIPELYLISIPKFDSKKVIKCNIFLWENGPFPPKEKILGSADSYQLFDFKKYTSLSEKDKKIMLFIKECLILRLITIGRESHWRLLTKPV